ncbi:MAG: hypothetical protein GC134_09825 [Proteobacteria bacterium]|nr:hypothetical protein [Pseudomonadota bacterium]
MCGHYRLFLIVLSMLATLPTFAFAQTPRTPGSADPGRIDRRLQEAPQSVPTESLLPRSPLPEQTLPKGAAGVTFTLETLDIVGATQLTAADINNKAGHLLGQQVKLGDIVRIAAELTRIYHSRGYTFSRVILPEQDIHNGRVVLKAVEGYISQVATEGTYADHPFLLAAAARLKELKPLHGPTLEHELLLLRSIPGLDVRTVLDADTAAGPGALKLTFKTSTSTPITVAAFDTYGSRFAGPAQASLLHVQPGSYHAPGKTEVLFSSAVPQDEMVFASITHSRLMTDSGGVMDMRLMANAIEPGHSLESFDIFSRAQSASVMWHQPVYLQRARSVSAFAGLDILDTRSKFSGGTLYNDRLRVIRAGWSLQNNSFRNSSQLATFTVSQGINLWNSSRGGSTNLSRADGSGLFTKVELQTEHVQYLTEDVTLAANLNGQYAFRGLLSSEEIGFGGSRMGRAYDSAEFSGDSGITGSLETRWDIGQWGKTTVVPYAFVDAAKLWERDGSLRDAFAASAGAGVRLFSADRMNINLSMAVPINRPKGAPKLGNGKSPNVYIGMQFKL